MSTVAKTLVTFPTESTVVKVDAESVDLVEKCHLEASLVERRGQCQVKACEGRTFRYRRVTSVSSTCAIKSVSAP